MLSIPLGIPEINGLIHYIFTFPLIVVLKFIAKIWRHIENKTIMKEVSKIVINWENVRHLLLGFFFIVLEFV